MTAHAFIGQLPHVPTANAGGVYLELVGQPSLVHQALHHGMGSRRAADVAEADEKYFPFHAYLTL